jgi:putative SOS response-associated peptidase YedK
LTRALSQTELHEEPELVSVRAELRHPLYNVCQDLRIGHSHRYPAEEMVARPVSTLVNNPRNDSMDCITLIDGFA